jgi:two-component system, OmpR family, response regulator
MADPVHVLIVDNSQRMVTLLERWLERQGFQVTGVTTVQEALATLATHAMDWVITDVMLPTGDGMDILACARTQQPQAKVIVMAAFGSEATRQRALTLGAHAFLSKPFSREELLGALTHQPSPHTTSQQGSPKRPAIQSGDGRAHGQRGKA